ncbi:MAG: response regulator, partial [Planctomycetales bacterium]|nr:response regulator [Planctomycetales bacterium]
MAFGLRQRTTRGKLLVWQIVASEVPARKTPVFPPADRAERTAYTDRARQIARLSQCRTAARANNPPLGPRLGIHKLLMTRQKDIDLLLVDDDHEFRSLMVSRFSRCGGFHVMDACSAMEALEAAQRREFDVAVFDLVMPGASGLELLEKFKAMHPECEVLLLTGQGTIETAVQAMKLGAYDFLTKPFPLKDLE